MTDTPMHQLLGEIDRDPGCEGAFEVLDQYVEALRGGREADPRFAQFVTHIHNCTACREDTESLRAALDLLEGSPPPR